MSMKQILMLFLFLPAAVTAQTLEECQAAAEKNYPLIRQYDLITKTTALTVANIQKGWLPQIGASAQATYQSDVTAWPDEMQGLMQQMGIDIAGLRRDQYRVGIDINQTLYDGGTISRQKEVARRQGEVQLAQTEVDIYNVRRRVNEMYFGLLLLDEQLRLNKDLQATLRTNEETLHSMQVHGTAAESDYNAVKAERLNAAQQMTSLAAQRSTLARLLSVFCGIEVTAPSKPSQGEASSAAALPIGEGGGRPELRAISAQLRLADAQERALDAALMPKLGVFAQGFYGYPGYNLFEDMMDHKWSLGGMVGARLSWNIGALYTRKNDKAKIQLQRAAAENRRDVFLFNNHLEQVQQTEDIVRYRRLMADDEEIIRLRISIRQAAESKLRHGIINAGDLVREIHAENSARVQQSVHEIEMLKEMYELRYTLNN
ncbi:MAG: TolC family protein [Bacteroidaceae bacterium]|nr:TolC family protein [Bacteroidaceae bacterium]